MNKIKFLLYLVLILITFRADAGAGVSFYGKVIKINGVHHIVSTDFSRYDIKMCRIKTPEISFNSPSIVLKDGKKVKRLTGIFGLNTIPEGTYIYFVGGVTGPYNTNQSDTSLCISSSSGPPILTILHNYVPEDFTML